MTAIFSGLVPFGGVEAGPGGQALCPSGAARAVRRAPPAGDIALAGVVGSGLFDAFHQVDHVFSLGER